jgi:DNA-binding beta-propeller fold protein YncE
MTRSAHLLFLFVLPACQPAVVDTGDPEPQGLAVLGSGAHTVDAVTVFEIASGTLEGPRDLAFHPDFPELLYVANRDDDSIVVFDTSDSEPEGDLRKGDSANHFLANPAALAFGEDGLFATAHEEDEVTQSSTPDDFMGPTLWNGDPDEFDGGWASHYDMLHNSPDSVGIAWERDNAYWVFDGMHGSLTRYDFNDDHGGGGEDHSDGEIARYAEGEVAYVEDVPSHLVFDAEADLLYVADSGNARVAVLDVSTGEQGRSLSPNYDGVDQYEVDGAEITTLVDEAAVPDLERPSGIELHDGLLYVGDNENGIVFAFTLEGELIDWLALELDNGALMGITFDADGNLWAVDGEAGRILRISPS